MAWTSALRGLPSNDAAISRGVVEIGAEQGHRSLLVEMEVEQLGDGLRRDLRSIAGENDHVIVGGERGLRDHQSVAGAALFGLQDEIHAGRRERGADAIGFVADDGEHIARGNDLRGGGDDMRQQRLASDLMQHFRQLRFKRVPFPAAMMAMATRGEAVVEVVDGMTFADLFIFPTIPWGWEQAKETWRVPGSSASTGLPGQLSQRALPQFLSTVWLRGRVPRRRRVSGR